MLLELLADDVVHTRATALRLRIEDLGDEGAALLPTPPGADPDTQLPPPETCDRLWQHEGAPGFLRGIEMRRVPRRGVWIRLTVPVVVGELEVGDDITGLHRHSLQGR